MAGVHHPFTLLFLLICTRTTNVLFEPLAALPPRSRSGTTSTSSAGSSAAATRTSTRRAGRRTITVITATATTATATATATAAAAVRRHHQLDRHSPVTTSPSPSSAPSTRGGTSKMHADDKGLIFVILMPI